VTLFLLLFCPSSTVFFERVFLFDSTLTGCMQFSGNYFFFVLNFLHHHRLLFSQNSTPFTGKTIQIISFLSCIFHKTGTYEDVRTIRERNQQSKFTSSSKKRGRRSSGAATPEIEKRRKSSLRVWPVLIVVPPAVLYNWKREIEVKKQRILK